MTGTVFPRPQAKDGAFPAPDGVESMQVMVDGQPFGGPVPLGRRAPHVTQRPLRGVVAPVIAATVVGTAVAVTAAGMAWDWWAVQRHARHVRRLLREHQR